MTVNPNLNETYMLFFLNFCMILYLNLEIKTLIINDVLCLQKIIEGYINYSCLENIEIFFIETQQRLW